MVRVASVAACDARARGQYSKVRTNILRINVPALYQMSNLVQTWYMYFTEATTSMPPGLCPWDAPVEIVFTNFIIGMPFTKEKMPWCPCPFKNEAYRPATLVSMRMHTVTKAYNMVSTACCETKIHFDQTFLRNCLLDDEFSIIPESYFIQAELIFKLVFELNGATDGHGGKLVLHWFAWNAVVFEKCFSKGLCCRPLQLLCKRKVLFMHQCTWMANSFLNNSTLYIT